MFSKILWEKVNWFVGRMRRCATLYNLITRGGVEIDGGLVGFLTAIPFGRAARGAVDQWVSLVGHKPGRLVHVQRVEIADAVIRPRRRPSRGVPIAHSVHSDLIVVFASRSERLGPLRKFTVTKKKSKKQKNQSAVWQLIVDSSR